MSLEQRWHACAGGCDSWLICDRWVTHVSSSLVAYAYSLVLQVYLLEWHIYWIDYMLIERTPPPRGGSFDQCVQADVNHDSCVMVTHVSWSLLTHEPWWLISHSYASCVTVDSSHMPHVSLLTHLTSWCCLMCHSWLISHSYASWLISHSYANALGGAVSWMRYLEHKHMCLRCMCVQAAMTHVPWWLDTKT